jgi:predicted GTPase
LQFIKLVTKDPSIVIGDSLESETFEVQSYRFRDPTSGRTMIMVDTPGFDDSREGVTDTEILKRVANFLIKEWVHP